MLTDPREAVSSLARELTDVFGDRLRSVVLYGSVARGEAVPGASDINVLLLLDRVDADALRTASPLARRWTDAGNTAPLLLTWEEWQRAADVFAIELADMHDAHEVVYGGDPLEGLVVDRDALRLQAERELRGKLLQLREGMLLAADRDEDVGRLLMVALPSFITYQRAALRLAGQRPPDRSEATIETAARLVGADPRPFLRIWEARQQRRPVTAGIGDPLVAGYYEIAERTAEFVDSIEETGRQ